MEAVFTAGVVFGAAGEIGVFACGEGGWDGDYWDRGWMDLRAFVGAFGEGFEVGDGLDLVGEGLSRRLWLIYSRGGNIDCEQAWNLGFEGGLPTQHHILERKEGIQYLRKQ